MDLQAVNRSLEKKKAMLEKERRLNQGMVEETTALLVSCNPYSELYT